ALSAARGRHGVMVQFRFGARTTSLLQIVSDRAHARYGNGLHCVQSFPFEAPVALGASVALDLNALELIENPAHHSLGSFGFREGMLQFVSFFPNAMHHPEMLPEVFDACVRRAESVSSRATGSNWAAPRLRPNSLTSLLERMRRH
ncbi:MAG: hypothetical protein HC809_13405, partial [Gammaproteobacteria bacterium]|nr:hypothetical protein [Gammaproteobacteria bacterium]